MSANQSDPVLERLNFFNGQRLAATDLRTEQGHHVGMRRVLNRSLYSPGIVVGLDVERAPEDKKDPTWKHKVIVRRGLAFDHLGREIFVPEDVLVLVMGAGSKTPGVVFGNLLTVSYRENRRHPVHDRCAVVTPYKPCSGDMPWGAPTRIAADWVFEFLDSWPADDSGKIVLGQIELNSKCEVVRVLPGVRRYAVPVKPQKVSPISLEGEKDIDATNPKVLTFHIAGGFPESALLYLRARKLSTLFYSEQGQHKHNATIAINPKNFDLTHKHDIGNTTTDPAGDHAHSLKICTDDADVDYGDPGGMCVEVDDEREADFRDGLIGGVPAHSHALNNIIVNNTPLAVNVDLTGTATVKNTGVTDYDIRVGNKKALTYFKQLKIKLNGSDVTDLILDQLRAKPGQGADWPELGNGLPGHKLASTEGTGEIDLLKLGFEIGLGAHKLEFILDPAIADNGGNLQYNLYVS